MPDILIRNVSQEIADLLTDKAKSAGMDRQTWLLEQLAKLAESPVIKQDYTIRCYAENGAFCQIERTRYDKSLHVGARGMSQEQNEAYKKAKDYISRNALGDREKAITLLREVFEEVFER